MPADSVVARVMRFRLVPMLLLGAVLGTILDGVHTHSGTTGYPHPVFWMAAWWTPPLFAVAYVILGVGYGLGEPRPKAAPLKVRALVGVPLFSALYYSSGYLPAGSSVKFFLLLIGGIALWAVLDRSTATLMLAGVALVVGPTFEIMLTSQGCFYYTRPELFGVAGWLPGLYIASAPGLAPFVYWFSELFRPLPK